MSEPTAWGPRDEDELVRRVRERLPRARVGDGEIRAVVRRVLARLTRESVRPHRGIVTVVGRASDGPSAALFEGVAGVTVRRAAHAVENDVACVAAEVEADAPIAARAAELAAWGRARGWVVAVAPAESPG